MSGCINHAGNFREKIKFCYDTHLCLLEETVWGPIDHGASFLPCRCKFTSGGCQGGGTVTDGLPGRQWEYLLYCGVIRGRRLPRKVSLSPSTTPSPDPSPTHARAHTRRTHPPLQSAHPQGWGLWSSVFNTFWLGIKKWRDQSAWYQHHLFTTGTGAVMQSRLSVSQASPPGEGEMWDLRGTASPGPFMGQGGPAGNQGGADFKNEKSSVTRWTCHPEHAIPGSSSLHLRCVCLAGVPG